MLYGPTSLTKHTQRPLRLILERPRRPSCYRCNITGQACQMTALPLWPTAKCVAERTFLGTKHQACCTYCQSGIDAGSMFPLTLSCFRWIKKALTTSLSLLTALEKELSPCHVKRPLRRPKLPNCTTNTSGGSMGYPRLLPQIVVPNLYQRSPTSFAS